MPANSLLEQALAFYREPARFRDFKDTNQPLSGEAGPLLRLAAGSAPDVVGVPPGLAEAGEWQAAARFFVQQVLLAPGANFYRLHGLVQQATADEIKEHHRLLMRLVHPDREHTDDAWQTAAAARINQAYATLRDPERRAQYDSQLDFAAQNARAAPVITPPAPMRPAVPRRMVNRTGDTPLTRYLWRHLPQVSLAGTALLAAVWVGWIWLSNPPSAALGGGDDGGTIVALNESVPAPAPRPAAQAPAAAPTPAPAPAPKPVPAAPVADAPRDITRNPVGVQAVPAGQGTAPNASERAALAAALKAERAQAEPRIAPPPPVPAVAPVTAATVPASVPKPAAAAVPARVALGPAAPAKPVLPAPLPPMAPSGPVVAPKVAAAPSPPAIVTVSASAAKPEVVSAVAAPVAVAANAASVPPAAAKPAAAPPAAAPANIALAPTLKLQIEPALKKEPKPDPSVVVPLLTQYYERGDLEKFMTLFHESARNDTGGRARIRKDYEDLFASTAARQLIVWDMHWQPQDDIWKGDGHFQVRVQRNNEGFLRLYNGTIKIDVQTDGGQPLIRGLFHRLSNQND